MAQPLTWFSPRRRRRRRRTTMNNFRCAKGFPLFVLFFFFFFFSSESPNRHSDSEVKEAEAKEEEEAYRRPMSTISSVCRRAVCVCVCIICLSFAPRLPRCSGNCSGDDLGDFVLEMEWITSSLQLPRCRPFRCQITFVGLSSTRQEMSWSSSSSCLFVLSFSLLNSNGLTGATTTTGGCLYVPVHPPLKAASRAPSASAAAADVDPLLFVLIGRRRRRLCTRYLLLRYSYVLRVHY